jgi:hypothetical protein
MNDLSTTLVESLVGSPIDENDWKHSAVKFLMMKLAIFAEENSWNFS